jgi:hypothetical protein
MAGIGFVVVAYLPLIGFVYCLVAYCVTRREDPHTRFHAEIGLAISVIATGIVVFFLIYAVSRDGWGALLK